MQRKFKYVRRRREHGHVEIAVDVEAMKEIFDYVGQDSRHKSKFLDIVAIIMEGLHNRTLYRREDISKEAKDVTAMRFFVGQENDRIYCKEISRMDAATREPIKIVVLAALHLHKKSNTLSPVEVGIINKIAGYEYEQG